MTPMTTEKKMTGEIMGRVTCRNFCHGPAPSMSAASYSWRGTSRRAARKMIMVSPIAHRLRPTSAGLDHCGLANHSGWGMWRSRRIVLIGPEGLRRKTNANVAATAGTIVGRKNMVR